MRIDIASKYTEALKIKFTDIYFDPKYMYYCNGVYFDVYTPTDSTWNAHEFVVIDSVEGKDSVIGYIAYTPSRTANRVNDLRVINFGDFSLARCVCL